MNIKDKWLIAQIEEKKFHDQFSYEVGSEIYKDTYRQYFEYLNIDSNLNNKNIIEIGCADYSSLVQCSNLGKCFIIEPLPSEKLLKHINNLNITIIKQPAEEIEFPIVDEIWIFNLLQHVIDPTILINKCKQAANIIRFFEPINLPTDNCHLWSFDLNYFNSMFDNTAQLYHNTNPNIKNFHTADCAFGVWKNNK